ncbi:MAG: methionyl-tRNA formyltransferase [Campylobacteraceae bacterium]|nr:methionyl-tRNA formyltransferase [Campylobacteraceae bacterium]MBT3882359.1 methionyl-tRNA formyltransferase [Campylobacteraceae bacterium]MBT4031243.1 methionyl-tRNA formyltransferase [Campylobacteraceae bacterium]MBT4178929.1 methionyl-tRNA formyltransferase [Campylobacteraceae bacterium]MBT4573156.1 methionyl-tRNA formyltransferase [Campylobacteraceae bacterium]
MNKRIIFMGTPDYATHIFKKLYESTNYDVVGLYTQPDKKVGRKQLLTPPHIKQHCIDNELELPIYQPVSLKDESIVSDIKNLRADFIIVAAYGQILPQSILDLAPCINLHASLLPKYRGASPIQQSILNNDKYSGVTAMMMEKGLDSGDILGLEYVSILDDMDVGELFEKLSQVAAILTISTLENYSNILPKKQNISKVSHCAKISKDDGLIEFNDSIEVYQKFKAYKYWPGIFLKSGLKIKECKFIENSSINNTGEVLEINKNSIIVGCNKGSIEIMMVQPASKKAMNVVDYTRGARVEIGNTLS